MTLSRTLGLDVCISFSFNINCIVNIQFDFGCICIACEFELSLVYHVYKTTGELQRKDLKL